jgi:hypothetical protein
MWDSALDHKSFRKYNLKETALKDMIGKLALEIVGKEPLDQ